MPLCGNRLHLQNINIFTVGATIGRPPYRRKSNPVGGIPYAPATRHSTKQRGVRKPLSVVDAKRQQGVAPTGGRGRARNFEVSICFGYHPPNLGCDNCINFPTSQSLHSLACSPTRSRGSPLPEGAFCLCEHCGDAPCFSAGTTAGRPRTYKDQIP